MDLVAWLCSYVFFQTLHLGSYYQFLDNASVSTTTTSNGGIVTTRKLKILDVGSFDVNGNMKDALKLSGLVNEDDSIQVYYTGLDVSEGPNVDVVVQSDEMGGADSWPFEANTFDIIVSSSAFEHMDFFWLTFSRMIELLKSNGMLYLMVPKALPEHRYPVDNYRFLPDAAYALAKWANRTINTNCIDCCKSYGVHVLYTNVTAHLYVNSIFTKSVTETGATHMCQIQQQQAKNQKQIERDMANLLQTVAVYPLHLQVIDSIANSYYAGQGGGSPSVVHSTDQWESYFYQQLKEQQTNAYRVKNAASEQLINAHLIESIIKGKYTSSVLCRPDNHLHKTVPFRHTQQLHIVLSQTMMTNQPGLYNDTICYFIMHVALISQDITSAVHFNQTIRSVSAYYSLAEDASNFLRAVMLEGIFELTETITEIFGVQPSLLES